MRGAEGEKVQLHRNNAASEKHGQVSKVPWHKKREDDPGWGRRVAEYDYVGTTRGKSGEGGESYGRPTCRWTRTRSAARSQPA